MSDHRDWGKLLCGSLLHCNHSWFLCQSSVIQRFPSPLTSLDSSLPPFQLIFPLQKGGEISVIGQYWNCKFDVHIRFLLPVFLTDEGELYPIFLREQNFVHGGLLHVLPAWNNTICSLQLWFMSIRVGWMLTRPLKAPVLQGGSQLEDFFTISQTNPGSETVTFGLKFIISRLWRGRNSHHTGKNQRRMIFWFNFFFFWWENETPTTF